MVSTIDTAAVCGHLNATLSGIIPKSGITKAVGLLVGQEPDNFVETAKQIGLVFHEAIQGRFDVDPGAIPCLPCRKEAVYFDWEGNPVEGNIYRLDWINKCLAQPISDSTIKLWAGLTNLKSAGVITDLSRSEKAAQREQITHTVTVDRHTRREWKRFLDKFIPKLVSELSIDGERQYDVLRHMPLTSKSSRFVDVDGKIKPCQRGSAEFADLSMALRHPVVNRLFRRYPQEAIAAAITACDAYEEEPMLNQAFPLPFSKELDLGSIAIAWKDAEKPRVVYILVGALDSLSRPMFHKLEEIESRWNMQGVMDQVGARDLVRSFLSSNTRRKKPKVVCSYDQSAFTDNFSYKYIQRPVVEALISTGVLKEFDLAVLDEICQGSWNAESLGFKFEPLTFGTGTGMGTPPSFPLASICNGLMVAFSYYKAYGKLPSCTSSNPPGLVVGDDCVIFDELVANYYEEFCSKIGLKINIDKSFRNRHVAEFCGKYITAEGIYSKRKLIYPSCLEAVKDFSEYYLDKVDDYFRAYPTLDSSDMAEVLKALALTPSPYGVGKKLETLVPETSTSIELIMQMAQAASTASDYLPQDLRGSRADIKEAIARNRALPNIVEGPILIQAPEPSKEPRATNVLAQSLARDVVDTYQSIVPTSSWEQLYQQTLDILSKLKTIVSLEGPKPKPSERVPTLTPKRNSTISPMEMLINIYLEEAGETSDDPDYWMDL